MKGNSCWRYTNFPLKHDYRRKGIKLHLWQDIKNDTRPETNITPKNGWLEDDSFISPGLCNLAGAFAVSFWEGNDSSTILTSWCLEAESLHNRSSPPWDEVLAPPSTWCTWPRRFPVRWTNCASEGGIRCPTWWQKTRHFPWKPTYSWWFKVTFLGWLSDPFKGWG